MSIGIRNLFEEATAKNINLKDKVGASFGSYGWSGEAPSLVFAILKDKFGMKMVESQLQIKNTPDDTGLEKCRELGKTIVNELMRQP